ncbi:MAG: SRPBCC domain-containing protein, partial [Actinobacteria bacterium]|nr:SRPBCC domain-containing protein [Actinomycetota bacterium]
APLRDLGHWLATLADSDSSERALARYADAIADERTQAARDPNWAIGRIIRVERELPAPVGEVWAHCTTAELVRLWWSPEHLDVVECEVQAVAGGLLEITLQEGDGRRYRGRGRFLTVTPRRRLRFELSHLAPDDRPVFTALHDLRLGRHGAGTRLGLTVEITAARPTAAAAVAGIELGWEQQLAKLARVLGDTSGSS